MSKPTLRDLAKAYSKGILQKENYREARATLINGILSGDDTLQVNEYPALVELPDEESLDVTERKSVKKKLL
ncbi:MAG: hypothetical protein IIB73_00760 [Proteobacteria bacterium]|nr:hypothetical protein [Pseudomonadota bacterium]